LIYSLVVAADTGYAANDRARRVQRQLDLLVWRLSADLQLMDRFYRTPRPGSATWWLMIDAKLKFLGHAEECLALAANRKVVALSAAQQAARQKAVSELRRLLGEVETRDLTPLRQAPIREARDLYQQIVGDVCHARHGLTLS
jgi:hypothetical protein